MPLNVPQILDSRPRTWEKGLWSGKTMLLKRRELPDLPAGCYRPTGKSEARAFRASIDNMDMPRIGVVLADLCRYQTR